MQLCIAILVCAFAVAHGIANETEHVSRRLLGLKPPKQTADAIVAGVLNHAAKIPLVFESWSKMHVPCEQAIFSCAFASTYMARDATFFAGTARKSGFTGDIVVAVLPKSNPAFLGKRNTMFPCTPYRLSALVAVMCGASSTA
jgi:hypothetical protein